MAKFFNDTAFYLNDAEALKEVTEADPKAIIDLIAESTILFSSIADVYFWFNCMEKEAIRENTEILSNEK